MQVGGRARALVTVAARARDALDFVKKAGAGALVTVRQCNECSEY